MLKNKASLDIVLVNTPQFDYSVVPFRPYVSLPPMGLGYIATWLAHQNYSVELIDGEFRGLSPSTIARIINDKKPRFLGINLLTPTYHIATKIIAEINPEIRIVVGGPHADALPMETMNDPAMKKVSVLVLGEGEYKMDAILGNENKIELIPGIAFRKGGNIIINEDQPLNPAWMPGNLDELPFIKREFLASEPFASEGRLEATMIASRGCPFNCSFCSASYEMTKIRPRMRSIQNILEEICILYTNYGVTAIRFVDDLLLGNIPFIRDFTKAYIKSGLSSNMVWQANARVSLLWNAADDVIENLALSGCRQLSIGIESGSQRVLDYINKKITPNQVRLLVKRLSQHGIRVSGYFIVGFPNESREEILDTISLFHELRDISRVHVKKPTAIFRGNIFEFRPYPKTVEWQRILAKGFISDELLNSYYPLIMNGIVSERTKRRWSSGIQFSNVPPDEIQQVIRQALLKQNIDLESYGGIPDFAWNLENIHQASSQDAITRIVSD